MCSALCGVAYGVEIPNLDDMVPDPWGDFNSVTVPSGGLHTYTISEDVFPVLEDVALSDDGIELYTISTTGKWSCNFSRVGSADEVITFWVSRGLDQYIFRGDYTYNSGRNSEGGEVLPAGESSSIQIPANSQWNCQTAVDYKASEYSKIYLSGTISAYPLTVALQGTTETLLTSSSGLTCQLVVNDVLRGPVYEGDTITLDNYELDLSSLGDIKKLGIYVKAQQAAGVGRTFDVQTSLSYYFVISDKFTISTQSGSGGGGGGVDEETKGLLATIIQWLSGIKDGIVNLAIKISQLPGLIADEVVGRLRSFFLPTDADLQALKTKYQTLLETRFGFIYQAYQMVDTAFTEFVEGWEGHGDYTFTFPGFVVHLNGESYVLCPPTELDTNNDLFTVLRNFLGLMVCFICVPGFVYVCEDMFIAIVSGKSYFDFLRGKEAEEEVGE